MKTFLPISIVLAGALALDAVAQPASSGTNASGTIKGIIRTPDGKPAAGLPVQIIGRFGRPNDSLTTDEAGRFEIPPLPRVSGINDSPPCLLVRDADRNLAAAQDIEEDTGDVDLKLAPGLTIAGSAECDGKPVTNAIAAVIFWTGNTGMHLAGFSRGTNTPGHFEIPALPPGRKYGIVISAPGYGQKSIYDVHAGGDSGRLDLDPAELRPANLKLAGQVVDGDDNPVSGVYVSMSGEGQPNENRRTDKNGRFSFSRVCEGDVRLFASGSDASGNTTAQGGDTNVVLRLSEMMNTPTGSKSTKLSGLITDPDGKPAGAAQVSVFPSSSQRWFKTGRDGTFKLTWSTEPWRQSSSQLLIARDTARNLAGTEELLEDVTNLNLQMKPALVIVGRVETAEGAGLANAQVQALFRAGNTYQQLDQESIATDAQGRYELKSLPADGRYIVFASAKDFGRSEQNVQIDSDTNRIELAPFILKPANLVIAGRVVDGNDKPMANVNVNLSGNGQPSGYATTDTKGRFRLNACEGQVRIFASGPSGYAQVTGEAGDTNLVIQLEANNSVARAAPRRAPLTGRPLPALTQLGFTAESMPPGKPALLCLLDVEQRSSRRIARLLTERVESLRQKGITVLAAQAAVTSAEVVEQWKKDAAVPFPVGRVAEESDQTRWVSATESVPWLILTDAKGIVVAEGFAIEELDEKVAAALR